MAPWSAQEQACLVTAARGQRAGNWQQRTSGVDSLPAGNCVIKAGVLLGTALHPHVGGDRACRGSAPLGPAVPPPSPPTWPAPVPWGPPHHRLLAPCPPGPEHSCPALPSKPPKAAPNTPARPCHPNHPRPRSPSLSVSWPREPRDLSVFLKTNAWLSSVSWWKNVKATDQMEAELIAWWQETRNFTELNGGTWQLDSATTETNFLQGNGWDRKVTRQLHTAQQAVDDRALPEGQASWDLKAGRPGHSKTAPWGPRWRAESLGGPSNEWHFITFFF